MKTNSPSSFHYFLRLISILMIVLIQLPALSLGFGDRNFAYYTAKNSFPQFNSYISERSENSNLVVFSNTNPISIADKAATTGPNGISTPYPSSIAVSGLSGTVSDVNVTISGITTARERDLNFALVAPNGAALMLLGDGGDLNGMSNVTLTFDDSAALPVPFPGAIASGTYRPSDYLFSATDSDVFPAPGPATVNDPAPEGSATLASTFNGISPNGNWNLYIIDDSLGGGASSVSGGWSIDVTTAGAVQGTITTIASNLNPALTTQSITFTSTTTLAAGGAPVTAGTVSFTNNGAAIAGCSNVAVNGSGQATCSSTLPEGTRTIAANYNGTGTFGISSGSLAQVVNSPTVVTGAQFCNNGGFTIADPGPGSVYPSNISVTGLNGTISNVRVRLNTLTAARPSNLDFLLVGPGGQAFQFMSDTGDAINAVNAINLIVDDAAPSQFPIGSALTGGTFRPTDFNAAGETDPYPAPAPASFSRPAPVGSSTFASVYGNANPNGSWVLYSVDDGIGGGASTVGGWCVEFALNQVSTTTTVASNNNPSIAGQNVTFTATVTAASGIPTGTVEFFDGAASLGTGTLSPTTGTSALATLTTNSLAPGNHNITAVYGGTSGTGGGGFAGSTSPILVQVVNAPTLSINDVTLAEGNSGTTSFTFTVSLSQSVPQTVTVNYATANGTATAGTDYTATSGTLTFVPGDTSETITVLVTGDTTVEPDETFFVNLSGPANATILDGQGVGTILNDDVPTLSINDVSQVEGNSGTSTFAFTVTLSQASSQTVSVNYATADNTATVAGNDYLATNGTLSFAPGETTKTVNVTVNGDTVVELDETFFVNLTSPTNATIADGQGLGTILNDDIPTLSINDISQAEGNAGTSTFAFTITLSQASPLSVSVDYATADGTATVAGNDYVALPVTTVTFAPGETTKTVNVTVNGDTVVELDETFFVNLTSPSNATVLDGQGVGTILNDDVPTLSINDISQVEGNSGTSDFSFTVTLSQASPLSVSVDYATADGTATVAGNDYLASSGTLTFAPGELTKTINVQVNGDTTVEPDETFFVNLTNPSNATISDNQGLGTILNDDSASLSINDVSQVEGNSGTSAFTFTITLSQASPSSVTVDYATADGTATVADNDYVAVPVTTVTFAPGELTKTVNVTVNGDTVIEPDETFFVDLSNPTNATIADGQGLGTILNDDSPALSINDVSQIEGNSGTSDFIFTVTLSQASPLSVTVDYQTADGTATVADNDYVAGNGTLTFAPGELTKTITVQVNGDVTVELDETFFVNLTNPSNATISDNQGLGTILNDDSASISISNVSQVEGNSGTSTLVFTVSLSQASPTSLTVDYATADGTATVADNDYVAANGTLTFAPGETSMTVSVTVNGDTDKESNEFFFVNLSNPSPNTTIVDGQGAGIIVDEDRPYLADFDGDRQTDASVFRPSTGIWYARSSIDASLISGSVGTGNGIAVPGDYDGDGITDFALWQPSTGNWLIQRSSDAGLQFFNWGTAGDLPVQGDYDGDGKTDYAVYRPSTGTWWIVRSSDSSAYAQAFGISTDIPVQGDFDGDFKTDLAVYRGGTWYVLQSSTSTVTIQNWGLSTDTPIAGDFDGDGRNDLAVYRDGVWWILNSLSGETTIAPFGTSTDVPVAGDYDGDGSSDIAIFRPSTGEWFLVYSSGGSAGLLWGIATDVAVPSAYTP